MSYLINDQISENTLRVIDQTGEFLGVFSKSEALSIARKESKDLIKLNDSDPPVCKIQEYDKFLYQQKKNTKRQKSVQTKEIKLRPTTDVNDMKVKASHVNRFLEDGNVVTIKLEFRGREQNNSDHAKETFNKFLSFVKNHKVISPLSIDNRNMMIQIKGV